MRKSALIIYLALSWLVPVKLAAQLTCNNWLYTPSLNSVFSIGDLDIPGDKITVEAVINRTTPYLSTGANDIDGDVVSKHNTPSDVNYLLRPNHAYITTTNGFFATPDICEIELNKNYHIAMVYDGSTLKFYRNGYLMSQVNASGNLFQNNWNTRIGLYDPAFWRTQFVGYVNEVRIWNVARTQDQIRSFMNSPLPNPTVQPGLQAYYTFDNLSNKQGNTLWNGTLLGSASINNTNTSCSFRADSCGTVLSSGCDNWLHIPNYNTLDYVSTGDLDITGNKITVEAQFAADTNYFIPSTISYDLVSKHTGPSDCNYLLRPVTAEITTTNGFYQIIACDYKPKKINHAALVYDGTTLKFYRNGYLMGSKPASGNLVTNDLITKIGNYAAGTLNGSLKGYMNEVRIWNIARTQAEIKAYMNNPLPNPATQPGLVAYYQFDNLQNKQGNTAWNGTLNGAASINNTVPDCSFFADSCITVTNTPGISGVINYYTPVISFDKCKNYIVVEDGSGFKAGDTVLIIQMKGAVVDSSNTAAFGTITDYRNAGNYEFNYISSVSGNTVELKNIVTRPFDIPDGLVQMIRVPFYQNILITDTLTCLPWDGRKGGVLVLNVRDSVNMRADISVSGRGFRGGQDPVTNPPVFYCYENEYYYPVNPDLASQKGESIAVISDNRSYGKGALANGGGGGNSHNSAGGGGSNAGSGGIGGYQYEGSPCNTIVPFDNRGIGGNALSFSNAANKIFMGGGGGAGQSNNFQNFQATGGNGSGIVIIRAGHLTSNTFNILAKGNNGTGCGSGGAGCHEGMGGGGGGGSCLLDIVNYVDNTNIDNSGGNGADMTAAGFGRVGPGGGGGGGITWLSQPALPANANPVQNGGLNGVCTGYGNDNWGAAGGQNGNTLFNLTIPFSTQPFRKNIDSVVIRENASACKTVSFTGTAYTNTSSIQNWQWSFGDNSTAPTQNISHTYTSAGTYNVKLVVTDINGCKDSITKQVTVTDCVTSISNIINYYTPVIAVNPCSNKITVEDGSGFTAGDTVLMIQMKGAAIDSSNTAAFGTINDYKSAGNYEFNYVRSVAGNIVELRNVLTRQYDIPLGRVQLIRVPYYRNVTVTNTLTCLPWDGRKGGVLVFNVQDTLELNADMNTSGNGFRGGKSINSGTINWQPTCQANGYFYPSTQFASQGKGEGIAELSDAKMSGRGALANGGGGGNTTNTGGGGGSNIAAGGTGGNQYEECGNPGFGGLPGTSLAYSNLNNRLFMGGGGGAGDANDPLGAAAFNPDGGSGGGIIIATAGVLKPNGKGIISNGNDGKLCSNNCNEGAGGGGAGGTILLSVNSILSPANIRVNGGKGADNTAMLIGSTYYTHGPGGGGSGGAVLLTQNSLPANATVQNAGGANGISRQNSLSWNAQPGNNGITQFNYSLPITSQVFKPNIDSVRITESLSSCKTFSFNGFGYTNTAPIQSWQWNFGDNGTASTQNISHTYTSAGTYNVKLVVTDINGCKDSISKPVTVTNCITSVTIINTYAAALSIDPCTNTVKVDDPSTFNAGDTVVLMQMKGASIDSVNSNNFGTVSSFNNAGKFEFNYVKNKTGNTIEFKNTFLNKYDALRGRVQLIRVPYYPTFTVTDTITCLAWDGTKGGVVILNSATDITLQAPIDVSNKGFRGGAVGGGFSCNNINNWAAPTGTGGTKGEGITDYIPGFEAGGARLANGGGGAYAANSGGGGGGNWGAGGLGGFHSNTCPSQTQSMNGQGLTSLSPQNFFLGGGGGGGQEDNGQPVAAGGNGGGMVILKASTLNSNDQSILANGESVRTIVRDEGGAGGGAGGTVLLYVNNFTDTLYAYMQGGDGSSNDNQIYPTRCHGPGGGGGGGQFGVGTNGVTAPVSLQAFTGGGRAGIVQNPNSACAGSTNGAANGGNGAVSFNLQIPEATVPFKKNIDSVRIHESLRSCKTFDFAGLAYTNTSPIQNWQWIFGDSAVDTLQNTSHTYPNYGPRTVKLIATDSNGCKDSVTKIVTTRGINFDFIFEQDICDPLKVQFTAVGDSTANIYWSHGDGIFDTTIRNPLHFYPGAGNYSVEYCTGNATTGCVDTVRKNIFIGWKNDDIIRTPDTTICFGSTKLLRSNIDSTLRFCWNPVSFLNDPHFANPTTSTPSTITYGLNADKEENNLVANGDFSSGNTGFSSDYDSSAAPLSIAEYFVGTSSFNGGPGVSNCNDHTTGTGNMLVAQCDFSATSQVWGQTVTIQPNTNYTFSAWIQSLAAPNTALLQLYINGNAVTNPITLFDPACTWKRYSANWNSGNTNTVELSIVHKSLVPGIGGYFAIDDIRLAPYSIKRETVTIAVDTPLIDTRTDTSICAKQSVQLSTAGAVSYSWSPATGLSNAAAANPVASPADTTKYIVTGTNAFGCVAKDSVIISIKPQPAIIRTGDTLVCRNTTVPLFASGGINYVWSPAAGLNNPNSPTPVASPANNIKYYVTVTGANNCSAKDSVTITLQPIPVFKVSAPQSVCLNQQARLNASGGNFYLWAPAALVSNASVSNPFSTATQTTLFSVLIRDTVCNYDTTLSTSITVLPLPTVTASKSNDINCAIGSAVLTATGASQYNWTPARGLDNITSPTPVASPGVTTTYTVTGTNGNGCTDTASVIIITDYSAKVSYSVPNAFSPNGDNLNDCFKLKYFGLITELQLTIYNRWGEKVFYTTNPNDCWDGTFKGNPCDPGNFVYYLKAKTTCGTVERKGNLVLVR